MCFSSQSDNSAQIARQREAERQARIRQGTAEIDANFSKFDDDFYGGARESYEGFYLPQVEDQYKDARKALTYNLAQSGNLSSSAGAGKIADLFKSYNQQRARIGEGALSHEQQLRGDVAKNRSELIAQLNSTADPSAAAATAAARASALTAPQPYSPLGDLFSTYTQNAMNDIVARNAGYRGSGVRWPGVSTGSNSVVTVGR